MNRKFLKKAFSQAELLVTFGVLGCIVALCIGMFNASKLNHNVELTKQARLDNTLRTATMSIIGKENKLSASQVCNASNFRDMLRARIAGANDTEIKVNGNNVLALRVKNLGTIAVQTASNCNDEYKVGGVIPVALYTSTEEDIQELNVPAESVPEIASADPSTPVMTLATPVTTSVDFVAYSLTPSGLTETASSATPVLAAATPVVLGSANKTGANDTKLADHEVVDVCYNGVYNGETSCPGLNIEFYQMWEDGDCSRAPTYCEGNGQLQDGTYVLTGKINLRCREGNGNFGVCACPTGQSYWIPGDYYTLAGKDGSKIIGLCVGACSDFDEHMVPVSKFSKECKCDTDNNYNWDPTLKKCVKPGECAEEYLIWDEEKAACVCNETYVRERLAEDEVYTGIAANQCKKKCDAANYWFPNKDKTDCERRLPECECLKELNLSDYQCYCKKAEDLTNASLIQCDVPNNKYYTGNGACVADCEDDYNSFKVRDTQNITSCTCQATKPAGMTLGNYEVYDPTSTITCRKCNPNYPNREYETDIGPGSCECKDINDPTLIMGNRQYYDPTLENCVGTCPEGQVPNPTRTGCQPDCGCLQKLVGDTCVCDENLTVAQIRACADFTGDIFDPSKATCQDDCNGTSHADAALRECVCDGCAEKYTGTTCVCDETVSTTNKCVRSDEKYDPDSLICKSCKSINREYNAQGECVCKQLSEIVFSDVNMVYDITQPNCEAPCDGILIRNRNNPQECVCPSAKPETYGVTAGYHYDNLAKDTGCISPCPIGDYCPGSDPYNPSIPAIDPQDPNPTIDTVYPEGDVYKCPCGTYGATTGLKTAVCSNLCPAGSKCSVPGTITPVPCAGTELCLPGQINQCNPSTCSLPRVPSEDHTSCVCSASKPAAYSLPAGYKYDSSQATCIRPCPAGDYCPGSKPNYPDQPNIPAIGTDPLDPIPSMDNNDKFTYKCPCGRYSAGSIDSKTSACMGQCYQGYYCTKGSTTPTQHECTSSQKCPTGLNTCLPESCNLPMVPNADQTACVCAATKPAVYSLPAGYKYDSTQANCIKPCPAGDYCPGSKPNYPDQPNIPTIGTDPLDPSPVMDDMDPFAYKCPCGKYSSGSVDSKTSACMGNCAKGYYCTKGSPSPTQNKCTASQKCPAGLSTCYPEECTSPYIPNEEQTACICGLSSTPPAGKYFRAETCEYIDCPVGHYCPGPNPGPYPNPEPDPNYPSGVIYCPCGMYQDQLGASTCKSDCALGYYCPKGSTSNKGLVNGQEHKCTSSQKCPVGTCDPVGCQIPMVPNADQTACVCASTKPVSYSLPAGYKYDSTQANCIKPCPAGDYCPGSKPNYPDQPNIPTIGTDPLDPSPVMDNNDKFAYKCPCGKYSSGSVNSITSACMGNCSKGYYCTKGSPSPTQNKCTSSQKCPAGLSTCYPEECTSPYIPNEEQTACICGLSSTPPAGKYFNASTCQYIDCPVGHYCPGPNPSPYPNPEPDPNYPSGVIYCPCGMYQDQLGASTCKSDCALGYYCPKGSESNKGLISGLEHKCYSSQRCPVGTCQPQLCNMPMVPSADQTSCVCNTTRPTGYAIRAGYRYNPNYPADGCMSPCPVGDYCPGSQPNYPDNPKVDPSDPNPIPDGNDPFVLKCPCGNYGSTTGLSVAACSGKCQAGYNCPAGSTRATQNKCSGQQLCKEGVCQITECVQPSIPNTEHTACVCASTKPATYVVPARYHYDANAGVANNCLALCPVGNYCPGTQPNNPTKPIVDPADPTPIVNPSYPTGDVLKCPCGNYGSTTGLSVAACSGKCQAGYNCPAGSTSATQNKCSGQQLCKAGVCQITECVQPMIPNTEHTACVCGLSPNTVPAGKYFDAAKCSYENCPEGHYCPGSNPDPNPSPQPDPSYPTGVIYCPCGTFGAAKGLATYACSGQCPIGYYCPQGSTNANAHQCSAGQACHIGTCEPDTCAFPTTSVLPYETCNQCMSEADIKKQRADYFKQNEIWVNDVTKACKKCKSNMVPVPAGGCNCPSTEPYWYNEKCNTCQNWGKLYFARNFTETAASCRLEKFLQGDVSCFDGSDGRVVPQDMMNVASKLSSTDKNRTFDNVFAYVISETSSGAQVIGVFTISSWYAAFPTDWDSDYNTATQEPNRIKGTCSQMCANINSSVKDLCISTCDQFTGNTNSMFDHCAYAVNNKKNPQFIGQSYGTRSDELCTGGEIKLKNNCFYDLGNVLRRRYSPLVLDLKGDGFAYTSVEDGVIFDLNKDGIAERTAWTSAQTEFDNAFLILDKNKNGQVDNGGELFGDQNGEENGFKELAKYDSNGDKVINKKDPIYTELRLWVDMNKNAKIDYNADGTSKELKTLEEAGVTEISVDFQKLLDKKGNVLEDMYGNLVGIMGKFKMMVQNAAGKLVETVRKMMDVFFVTQ